MSLYENHSFTHLHVHSHFSTLDGIATPEQLVTAISNLGQTACALTDHGNLYGAIQFYKAAKAAKIKPILGIEAYVTFDEPDIENPQKTKDNYHMVLLAQNMTGWKTLLKLSSDAFIHNFYYNPRVNFQTLLENNEGLIVTTACIGGIAGKYAREVNGKLVNGGRYDFESKTFSDPDNTIIPRLQALKEAFSDRFYLEIQPHNFWEQHAFNRWAIEAAYNVLNVPLILTNDIHYVAKEDQKASMMVTAQKRKALLSDIEAQEAQGHGLGHYYIKDTATMFKSAAALNCIEAAVNTQKIADECNVELVLGQYQMPELDITSNPDYAVFQKWTDQFECSNVEVDGILTSLLGNHDY